jgi:hypothetical protein
MHASDWMMGTNFKLAEHAQLKKSVYMKMSLFNVELDLCMYSVICLYWVYSQYIYISPHSPTPPHTLHAEMLAWIASG